MNTSAQYKNRPTHWPFNVKIPTVQLSLKWVSLFSFYLQYGMEKPSTRIIRLNTMIFQLKSFSEEILRIWSLMSMILQCYWYSFRLLVLDEVAIKFSDTEVNPGFEVETNSRQSSDEYYCKFSHFNSPSLSLRATIHCGRWPKLDKILGNFHLI